MKDLRQSGRGIYASESAKKCMTIRKMAEGVPGRIIVGLKKKKRGSRKESMANLGTWTA